MNPDDSKELVARCQAGDAAAFRALFQRHQGDVTRLAMRLMGRRPDLEDVVQDVFLQVFRSITKFRGDAKFSTWLHRVTVNVVLMKRRAARSRPTYADEPPLDVAANDQALPDEATEKARRMVAFRRCIDGLSEKKRTVFVLHELEGLATTEIATIVDAPTLTVRTRLFYARKELSERMAQEPALAAFAHYLSRGKKAKECKNNPITEREKNHD